MKIAVFDSEPHERAAYDRLASKHDVSFVSGPLRLENAADYADTEILSVFIYSRLDRDVLDSLPSLKLIATRSTGYDHIDIELCRSRHIIVCNVPVYGENTVAEHVFALLLAISHRLPEAIDRSRSGRFSPDGLEGFDLASKTLGVIGTGNIGRHVVRIAKGFLMDVLAHDMIPDHAFSHEWQFRYCDLYDLLAESDVISLHVPSTPQTHEILSFEAFERMKDGVVIINTARGDLIDHHALIMALRSGKVSGAGLDVLPDEPLIREEIELICKIQDNQQDLRNLIADHILLHMPNVVVTPHSAFNTREAIRRIVDTTVDNVEAFVDGRTQNMV